MKHQGGQDPEVDSDRGKTPGIPHKGPHEKPGKEGTQSGDGGFAVPNRSPREDQLPAYHADDRSKRYQPDRTRLNQNSHPGLVRGKPGVIRHVLDECVLP